MRGNAMSGAPIISGTSQLPNPPIIAGMIMKNIMISPCAGDEHVVGVRILEYLQMPGYISSARIIIDSAAADAAPRRSRRPGTSCRCPCGSSNRRSAASRADGRACAWANSAIVVDPCYFVSAATRVDARRSSAGEFLLRGRHPGFEIGLGDDLDLDRHVGVARAAQLASTGRRYVPSVSP